MHRQKKKKQYKDDMPVIENFSDYLENLWMTIINIINFKFIFA